LSGLFCFQGIHLILIVVLILNREDEHEHDDEDPYTVITPGETAQTPGPLVPMPHSRA
jgi:hypothetical protein